MLERNTLFSATGQALDFGDLPRKYRTIAYEDKCNGAGTFDSLSQRCTCDLSSHRVGTKCESCDMGFQFDANQQCVRYDDGEEYYFTFSFAFFLIRFRARFHFCSWFLAFGFHFVSA
jgi:hypothetical protein